MSALTGPARWTVVRRVGIVVALLVILLRPGYGRLDVPAQVADVDVFVVVDRTRSMAALDYGTREPRIFGAQADLKALAADLPGARFAMIAVGAEARQVLPLTTDSLAFDTAVETLDLESPQGGDGSQVDRAVTVLDDVLTRAADAAPDRRRVVVYVGDGEQTRGGGGDTAPAPSGGYDVVRPAISGGVVLGYGTEEGAVMPEGDLIADGADPDTGDYVTDSATGQSAVSRADLGNLRDVADQLDVPFEHRTEPDGIDGIAEAIGASYAGDDGLGGSQQAEHDLTWLAGLALLALLLAELRPAWRAIWRSRDVLDPRAGAGR